MQIALVTSEPAHLGGLILGVEPAAVRVRGLAEELGSMSEELIARSALHRRRREILFSLTQVEPEHIRGFSLNPPYPGPACRDLDC